MNMSERSAGLVSVVITTKNEERNIDICLGSIRAQSYPYIEVIVVDNYSTDKTRDIALRYTDTVLLKGPERSAQRNYGMIDIAKGEFVMFIDADMILPPGLLEACVKKIRIDYRDVALHISEVVLGNGYWSRVRRFERSFYDGTVIDGARFFRKSTFVEVGGFNEELFREGSGEDWDIDKRIKQRGNIALLGKTWPDRFVWAASIEQFICARGVKPSNESTVIFHNEADFKLMPYLQKKSYYARGFDGYIQKWGQHDPDIRMQFGLWYRYFGVFLERGKWLRLLGNPGLAVGMYFLRVAVGVVFLFRRRAQK
jgi:glycosyltransferase involved in cell wall biosynthesis